MRTLEDRTDYTTRHSGKILATLEDDGFLEEWSTSSPKTYRITSQV